MRVKLRPLPIVLVAAAVAVAASTALLALSRPAGQRNALADLDIYRGCVRAVEAGRSLYSFTVAWPDKGPLGFTYPPFAGLLMRPLAWLPDRVGDVVWTAGGLLVVVLLAWFAARRPGAPSWHPAGLALALFASQAVVGNIVLGQVSVGLAWMCFVDAARVPPRWRGGLTGLAGGIKLTPLVFLLYFAVTRQWRALVTAVATCAATVLVGFVALPADSWSYWTTRLWETSHVGQISSGENRSLLGVLTRWAPASGLVKVVWVLAVVVVLVLAMRATLRHYRAGEFDRAAVVTGVAGTVVLPITWTHYLAWGVLACWLMATARRPLWTGVGLVGLAAMSIVSPLLGFPMAHPDLSQLPLEWQPLLLLAVAVLGLPSPAGPAEETLAQADGAAVGRPLAATLDA